MIHVFIVVALSLFSFSFQNTLPIASFAFNASNVFILPSSHINSNYNTTKLPPSSHILKDVLKAISVKHGWELEKTRVLNVDVGNAKVGVSQRYEFRIRMGKTEVVFKFSEELDSWRKLRREGGEFDSLLSQVSSTTVLDRFQLDGPFELSVYGDDDQLTLVLPLNVTHSGLKRLLVGEGITIDVEGAREVSLFQASHFGLPVNRSSDSGEDKNEFWPFRPSSCAPLPPVNIFGSASLVAYRTRNPNAFIGTTFLSQSMVELLPDKCYKKRSYKKQTCPIHALSPRLAVLEKLMKNFLGDRIIQNGMSGFLNAKIRSSTLVQFQLLLERDIGDNDTYWGRVEDWKTKPTSERVEFEVVARVEAERLKPMVVKKVRPFISADTTSWSTLMSNLSFTKFPAIFVPPEALTLDVKW